MRRACIALLLFLQIAIGGLMALGLGTAEPVARRHSFRLAERSLANLEQLDALAEERPTDRELTFAIAEPAERYLRGNGRLDGWIGVGFVVSSLAIAAILVLPRWKWPRMNSTM